MLIKRWRKKNMMSAIPILSIVVLIFLVFQGAGHAAKLSGSVVKFGALVPITGFMAGFGEQQELVIKMAEEEINKAGGIGGVPLKIITYDTAGKVDEAVKAMRKLLSQDKVPVVFGPFLTSECESVFPIAVKEMVPIISASSATPGIAAKFRPWAFRDAAMGDAIYAPVVKKWKELHGISNAVIMTDIKDVFLKVEGTKLMPKLLADNGINILEAIEYQAGDLDFTPQVTKIKTINPNGVVLASNYHEGANIIRTLRQKGLNYPVLGGLGVGTPELLSLGGSAVEGTIIGAAFWPDNPAPATAEFVKKFRGKAKPGLQPNPQAANIYDTIYITKKIIEESGVTNDPDKMKEDREKIRDGWAKLKDYNGAAGMTSIDANGDAVKEVFILVAKGGKWERIK